VVGGIGGVSQTQIRAVLAYSSIGHVGWIVLCVLFGENVLQLYFILYAFVSGCIFYVL